MLFLLVAGFSSRWLLIKSATPPTLQTSYLFPESIPLSPFSLTDQYGNPFTQLSLKNTWSLIFVGFTSCPDVCPTTMNKLAAVYPQINDDDLQVIFMSVDPKRDTLVKLKHYMDYFNTDFIGVTAEHNQLFPLVKELGLIYSMVGNGENYTVDHSASMVLISPEGEKVAVIKPKSVDNHMPQIYSQDLIIDINRIKKWY